MELIRSTLEKGDCQDILQKNGYYLLWAIEYPPLVQLLLAHGANPNAPLANVNCTQSILHVIATRLSMSGSTLDSKSNSELLSARLLCAKGANIDALDSRDGSILDRFTEKRADHNHRAKLEDIFAKTKKSDELFRNIPDHYASTTQIDITDEEKQRLETALHENTKAYRLSALLNHGFMYSHDTYSQLNQSGNIGFRRPWTT
jgi:hypothetical protein